MRWLVDGSVGAVREALRVVAPELAEEEIVLGARIDANQEAYWRGTARVGEHHLAKFAWSAAAAVGVERERLALPIVRDLAPGVPLPEVVHSSPDPLIFTTRHVAGGPCGLEPALALAEQLAEALAALHAPAVRDGVRRHGVPVAETVAQSDTDTLRRRFVGPIVTGARAERVTAWCAWVDDVLGGEPPEPTLVHGDLHGHNLVVDEAGRHLRLVVDLEQVAIGDPCFDLRYLVSMGPGVAWFVACREAYQRRSGRALPLDRIVAWHILTALGDALWRTELAVPLPVGGTVDGAVDAVARRMAELHVSSPDTA